MNRIIFALLLVGCGGDDTADGGGDGDGGTVTVETPNAPDAVVAYRDGVGAWTVLPAGPGPHALAIESGRYSVAIGCPDEVAIESVDVYELTTADLTTLVHDRECQALTGSLAGTLAGVTGGADVTVRWGQVAYFLNSATTSYGFGAPEGTHDLVATRGDVVVDRLVIARDVVVPGGQMPAVDFEAATAIPLMYTRIFGVGNVSNTLVTAGGTRVPLGYGDDRVVVVPGAALAPGDFQILSGGSSTIDSFRQSSGVSRIARVAPSTLDAPPYTDDEPALRATAVGTSEALLEVDWAPQADAQLYVLHANDWTVHVSPAAFAETTEIETPDLSAVAGWSIPMRTNLVGQIQWHLAAVWGAPLQELVRVLPTSEHDRFSTGWGGETRPL